MTREERHDKYAKAIAALVEAKVAFASWDKWQERHMLADALELVSELCDETEVDE